MKPRFLLILLALLACAALAGAILSGCGDEGISLERAQLDSGPVTGLLEDGVWSFKGIPYAAPPVGQLRWKPPQPVTPWTQPRACTAFGPACPQPDSMEFYQDAGVSSEDCLYLNVWSPAETSTERLPVMVWIHGGSFTSGAGSLPVYNGRHLAEKGVVVVTINYRLGPLGFLAHPALAAESASHGSGNYGLMDQMESLRWVQRNIAAFGGDPQRVTVFGESAGAISILDLLVSPQAEGLFQRAIAQSGIMLDAGFGVSTAASQADAEQAGVAFAARLGIEPSGDVAAQMRSKSVDELLAVSTVDAGLMDTGLTWTPCVDGAVLSDLPSRLWAADKQMKVPLLIGSNKDEGNAFLAGLMIPPARYQEYMRNLFGGYADEALALYPAGSAVAVLPALSRMLTEIGFASTARFAAATMGASPAEPRAPAYLYQFTRVPFGNALGAFHGVEIPYVFGTAELFTSMGTLQKADYDLSAAIQGYWTRFAATGDPNGGDSVQWPAYDAAGDTHLQLGDTVKTGAGLYKQACDLADKVRAAAR